MAITTTSIIADTIPTILEQAEFTREHKAVMAKLVWSKPKGLHDGLNVNIPYWGTITANSLSEGSDMASPTSMADTLVTITPGEVGAQITITDKVARDNQEDVKRAAGRILGDAVMRTEDEDLLGEIDNASESLGGTGTTLTLGHIAAARALLAGNERINGGPAPTPQVMVHHPYCLLDIVDVLTPLIPTSSYPVAGALGIADDIVRNYDVYRIFGMPVVAAGNFSVTSGRVKGGVFSQGGGPGAIVHSIAKKMYIEPERDASLRATELNCVTEYGVGVYQSHWIVELHNDASTPG